MHFLYFILFLLYYFTELEGIPSINELSLEEKVGQLLLVHFNGEMLNEDACLLIEKAHVGGFIYYKWANGLYDPQHVLALSKSLQNKAKIPLFIAVDQEGGRVSRLTDGFSNMPAQQKIAQAGCPETAKTWAYRMGKELRGVGININLAPLVDIATPETNASLSDRMYGQSCEEVTRLGGLSLDGYAQANVIATLKHYPGYGAAKVDPHGDLPVIQKSREELEQWDLVPFRTLATKAKAIMTAHILLPQIDKKNCVTFSKGIVEDILRKEWGFQGLIITDSLVMQGALNQCHSVDEGAIRALEAGHDILLLGGKLLNSLSSNELSPKDVLRIHKNIVQAVSEGRLSEDRINASVSRILKLKEAF